MNLRGYPGKTADPDLPDVELVGGKQHVTQVPCFADPRGTKTIAGIQATLYTVNQDADQWHVLYAWHAQAARCTRSAEHVAPPLTLPQASSRTSTGCCGSLVLVQPASVDVRLTRRQLLAAARRPASRRGAGSTSSSTSCRRLAVAARPRAACRPSSTCSRASGSSSDNGVEVLVPPLHHQVVTAGSTVGRPRPTCGGAGASSSTRSPSSRRDYDADARPGSASRSPGGCRTSERFVPEARRRRHLPRRPARVEAEQAGRGRCSTRAASRATRPRRSSRRTTSRAAAQRRRSTTSPTRSSAIFERRSTLFDVTSIRRGFAGGGFDGGQSLPKQMAMAAGVPGADLIPDSARSSSSASPRRRRPASARAKIANFETLGFIDRPAATSAQGTHLHLSHITEDLEAWYLDFAHDERVATAFRPGLERAGRRADRPAGAGATSPARARCSADYRRDEQIGHSAVAPDRRRACRRTTVGADGTRLPAGHGDPAPRRLQHARQPVLLERRPERDGDADDGPAAGVHFVVFNPSSDDFDRNRLAMDGVLPDGTKLAVRAARPRPGLQLDPAHDPPPELPRAAAAAPLVPARRAARVTRTCDPPRGRPDDAEAIARIFRESRAEAMPWLPVIHPPEDVTRFYAGPARRRGLRLRGRRRACSGGRS